MRVVPYGLFVKVIVYVDVEQVELQGCTMLPVEIFS